MRADEFLLLFCFCLLAPLVYSLYALGCLLGAFLS